MEELHFDPLDESTASGVTALFRAIYGEAYPDPAVYENGRLLALQQEQRRWTWVARNQENAVVGSVSILRQAPNPHVYTLNHAVVLPDYRGRSVALQLTMFAASEVLQEPEVAGSLTETGCDVLKNQELVYKGSYLPAALLPDSQASLLVSYLSLQDAPHTVHLPPRARRLAELVYGWLGVGRDLREATLTPGSQSDVVREGDRLSVKRCGADLIQHVPRANPPRQVVLALDSPEVGFGEELLHQAGYRPCGLYPRWFGCDGAVYLRSPAPSFEGDQLYSEEARQLWEAVRSGWQAG